MRQGTNQIDTMLRQAGLEVRPSARLSLIVDRVAQSRGTPGAQVTVDTTALSAFVKDFAGRTGHLIGIRFETAVQIAAATASGVDSPHALHGCIYNVELQGQDGHTYVRSVDGRAMIFDGWARAGHIVNSPPLAPDYNSDVTDAAKEGTLLYPMPNPTNLFGLAAASAKRVRDISTDFSLIGRHGMAGLIPLADIVNNNGQLRFKLATATPYGDSAIEKYIVQGQTELAVRVVFDVMYLDGIFTSRRWILDDYTVTVADGPYKYPGFRHSYIAHRNREEDMSANSDIYGALVNADLIDNFKVTLGSSAIVSGLSDTELRARLRYLLEQYPDGEINTWDRQSALPAFICAAAALADGQVNDGTDYLTRLVEMAVPFAQRAKNRPVGAVTYSVAPSAIPSGGVMRIIHRVEGTLSEAPIASAVGCGCHAAAAPSVIEDEKGNELLTTARRRVPVL